MHKPEWLSKGAEVLLERWEKDQSPYDVVIVGSGYGGAVAAARLAGCLDPADKARELRVCVLERGREHLSGTFPSSFSQLPGHLRYSRFDDPAAKGASDGLFDFRIGQDVSVLVGNGLGGGSLFNAGLLAKPHPEAFQRWPWDAKSWPNGIWNELANYYREAERDLLAGPAPTRDLSGNELDKHAQFRELMRSVGADAVTANVTVDGNACVRCGDCATGCNVGARNTLSTSYLRTAWEHGAELYTGATVSHVERRAGVWAVLLALTAEARPLQKQPLREIYAKTVILAAGALGSTEILMRSREKFPDLKLSRRLGTSFSTNGDMISAFYKPTAKANAAPEESTRFRGRHVGPTITSIAHAMSKRGWRIVVEELAVPGALRRVFEEAVTTSLMLHRLGEPDKDPHPALSEHDPSGGPVDPRVTVDPAAVDPEVVQCVQVLAAMGDDGAQGRLELVPGWDDARHRRSHSGGIRIHWPEAGKCDVYGEQDELLRAAAKASGGVYLPNPLWKPLPGPLAEALGGAKPTGMLFSVHPLGGCPMGTDVRNGVVDHLGRVFDPENRAGTGFHEGLLVLDGAIVPAALGVNPLLTITALAKRAIEIYAGHRLWVRPKRGPRALPPMPVVEPQRARPAATRLSFAERMTGELRFGAGVAQEAELKFDFQPDTDVVDFLRSPLHVLAVKKGTLKVRKAGDPGLPWQGGAGVSGSVQLLVRGATDAAERTYQALNVYRKVRALADLLDRLRLWRSGPLQLWTRIAWLWKRLRLHVLVGLCALYRKRSYREAVLDVVSATDKGRGYVNLASQVGEVRYLFYELKLDADLCAADGSLLLAAGTRISGRKTLAYRVGGNPWRQLTELSLTAHPLGRAALRLGELSVDPAYFFRGFASQLQITQQRDLPAAWMDLASLGLFLARIILKIHFWSFRLPEYQKYDPKRDENRMPGELEPLQMRRYVVGYPETPRDAGIFLPITRYRASEHCPRGPVVLFHGLGSGGIQFATQRVKPNMAQHLAEEGFDVWVSELRTSIALPYSADQWTIDEVARGDVPRIVDFVLDKTGARKTKVVAHCIGSAMFCTAVLDGRLQHSNGESKIDSAVLLQVGPLITLSKGTRLRGLVGAPLRRFFPEGHVDFSVDERAGWAEAMIDRLLNTYPYPPEEAAHHRVGWSWRQNAHIANCNRWTAIDGRMFRHENLSEEMLEHLGEVLGHSSLTTWTQTLQYAFLERLTDSDARDAYVTTENVHRYFRFPVRFLHGEENDVFHPLTSLRSQELIRRVHGAAAADLKIIPRFGHFDPLIGKYADTLVFPFVSGFLAEPPRIAYTERPQAPRHYFARRPLVGPVIGWTRWDKEKSLWRTRIWCRIDDLRSAAECVLVQVFREGQTLGTKIIDCPTDPVPGASVDQVCVGPIDTVLCTDVDLGKEAGCYEVVVLSLHGSLDATPPEDEGEKRLLTELQRAEASAGKAKYSRAPQLALEAGITLRQKLATPGEIEALIERALVPAHDTGADDKIDRAHVVVPKAPVSEVLTFAAASCRYPGWMFDRQQADAAFGAILRLAPSALLLTGDQIYADATAGAFDPKDRRERFYEAYREAWTAPHAREVLSRVPVYMMMDDHEAGNDWHPEDRLGDDERKMHEEGLEAFRRYQWLHSPGNVGQPRPKEREREAYYYDFAVQGFPFFVCDTRSGRSGRARILDERQFQVLKGWLKNAQAASGDTPKLVVSPSVVVPFLKTTAQPAYVARSDGWDGFPAQLAELFAFVFLERVENVVFLCGDPHLSMRSEIWFEDEKGQTGPKAFCIVGSPMYAPYPFANAKLEEYQTDGRPLALPGAAAVMWCRVTETAARNNFALVTVKREGRSWTVESRFLPEEQRERKEPWTIRSET